MKLGDLVQLIILAAIWGASFLFMRIAAPDFGPVVLMALRVLTGALCLLPILFFYKQIQQLKEHYYHLFFLGLFSTAIPFTLFGYASLHLQAGICSVLNTTTSMFGVIIAFFWFKEKITRSALLGLLLGFVGIFVLLQDKITLDNQNNILLPTIAILCATFCYAFSANYAKKHLSTVKPLIQATGSLLWASIILLPFTILYLPLNAIPQHSIYAVIFLGVFCTGIAYFLFFRLLANIGPNKTISVTYLIPIFGILWGATFLDELITFEMLIGVMITLLGVSLATGILNKKR